MSDEKDDKLNESTPTEDSATDKNVKKDEDRPPSVQVNEDDKKANEEDHEEPKEIKKPSVSEKKDVAITVHDDVRKKGTPTPKLKIDTPDIPDETGPPIEKRPSVFFSPIKRLKYEWRHSDNVAQFVGRVLCLVFRSVGWFVLVGGVPFVSIVQLVIGCVYLHDCPAQRLIPIYLIVAGVFGTILHVSSIFTKYAPNTAPNAVNPCIARIRWFDAILQIFLFVWFITGCVWVYSIFQPDYVNKHDNHYCHKVVYLVAFWLFNITFMVYFIVLCIAVCALAAGAFSS